MCFNTIDCFFLLLIKKMEFQVIKTKENWGLYMRCHYARRKERDLCKKREIKRKKERKSMLYNSPHPFFLLLSCGKKKLRKNNTKSCLNDHAVNPSVRLPFRIQTFLYLNNDNGLGYIFFLFPLPMWSSFNFFLAIFWTQIKLQLRRILSK